MTNPQALNFNELRHKSWCLIDKPECGPVHCTCRSGPDLPIRAVTSYHVGTSDVIMFRPVKGAAPGYSHRVILNGQTIDWLGDHIKPSIEAARFYALKHANLLKSLD